MNKSEGHIGAHIPFSQGFGIGPVWADTMYVRRTQRSTAGLPSRIPGLSSPGMQPDLRRIRQSRCLSVVLSPYEIVAMLGH